MIDRKALIGLAVIIAASLFVLSQGDSASEAAAFEEATVYYSSSCGCCANHISYLESAGADVKKVELNSRELEQLKDEKNIPDRYRSCHTTVVEDRFVEGHVPVEVFNEFMEGGEDIDGIALPGMPPGSPGMPGAKTGTWTFHSIKDGEVKGDFVQR